MYRFSYVDTVGGKAAEVTPERFREIIRREAVKKICSEIAAEEMLLQEAADEAQKSELQERVSRLKRGLPAFCWHAWFTDGKRKNYAAHPSGLVMLDVDHVSDPRALWTRLEEQSRALGVLVAHVTPSTHGLRLVFPCPRGLDIVRAQRHFVKALSLTNVDACTKDLARLSFCVPEEYFLFLDEERLFGEDPLQLQWSLHPLQFPRYRGTETQGGEKENEENDTNRDSPLSYHFEPDYKGIPYKALVESLQEQLGGVPAHGSRNNFIFSMAAYLRYVCDDDPEWIASVLPTYGEARDRWRRTIDSACQRAQYRQMPQIVQRAIELAKRKTPSGSPQGGEGTEAPAGVGEDLPPEMPKKLPPLIRHLVKNVPEVCRPAVANAVFPALAAHLKGVRFPLIDGTEKEATLMCVTLARQSSGKSAVNKPIEYITADIVERDEINRQREQEWKDATAQKGANKEKPKRPNDLCVQVLVSDMTNAAFVQRLKDAGGRYLYTNIEELDLLKQLQTNGTKDVGKIICLCFDNGKYGQERVGTQSVTARVEVRWNWNASSTIRKGLQFFRDRLVDGTLSRVNFCTIVPDKSKPFVYGNYDEQYAETLRPYITNLNLASGQIRCQQALRQAQMLERRCMEEGDLADDEIYENLAHRAVTIAYLKAMVLYVAQDMTWSKEIADFVDWSLRYDLWCKMHFFGQQMREESSGEEVRRIPGRQNLLDLLPDTFSIQTAIALRRRLGMPTAGARQMINSWTYRGYITRADDEETPTATRWTKTELYFHRGE